MRIAALIRLVPALFMTLICSLTQAAEFGVTDSEILVGQPGAITGPLADLAPDIINSTQAYLDAVNAKGGVHGRRIKLQVMDDGYVPDRTVKIVQHMLSDEPVFALMNMTGTSNVVASLPLLATQNPPLPLVGPFTGASALRSPATHHLFNIRAGYSDETEKIVEHLTTIGFKRIGVLWSNNGLGKDGLAGVLKALDKRGLKAAADASIEQNASDTDKAVATLQAADLDAVIMITAGAPTVSFIKAFNKKQRGMHFYALSVMGTQATLKALGADGIGVVVSSVVPFPWDITHPLAREYRAAMDKAGFSKNVSFLGFESYINAKVFVEALRESGKDLTRSKFVQALANMKNVDMGGGFRITFGSNQRQGSNYVGLVLVSAGEKFTK